MRGSGSGKFGRALVKIKILIKNGSHNDVRVSLSRLAGSSGYRLEVAQLAAPKLVGRDRELRGMAEFALGATGPSYWWWTADPWAGKTALMAHFYLNPPDGVDVLGFFITRRQASASNQAAFLARMGAQLREYLDDGDFECTWHGQFLEGLQRAAAQAAKRGRRLVLVVDGLDEDTDMLKPTQGHSIAALLPEAVQLHGARVIVASRINPGLPVDVPPDHPLRDAGIVHQLAGSKAARAVRADAERDLDLLLNEPGEGQEILYAIAASGGGLTGADLATITGLSERRVERTLEGHVGRSFQVRIGDPLLGLNSAPLPTFSFAHEELRAAAEALIGVSVLAKRREGVRAYVETWHRLGWPDETPEYALVHYPNVLTQLGDRDGLLALALDDSRRTRLWQSTGSDAQALDELGEALNLQLAVRDTSIDLAICVELAFEAARLASWALETPEELICLWARLGHTTLALRAASNFYPDVQAHLLPQLVGVGAEAGEELLSGAIALIRSLWSTLARAEALARAGQRLPAGEQLTAELALEARSLAAAALAERASGPVSGEQRDTVKKQVALALAHAGCVSEAVDFVNENELEDEEGWDWKPLISKLKGQPGWVDTAGHMAQSIEQPAARAGALTRAAGLIARDDPGLARNLFDEARRLLAAEAPGGSVRLILMEALVSDLAGHRAPFAEQFAAEVLAESRDVGDKDDVLYRIAKLQSTAGLWEPAELTIRRICRTEVVDRARAALAVTYAIRGESDAALGQVRQLHSPVKQDVALEQVLRELVRDGHLDEAERCAQFFHARDRVARWLADVAGHRPQPGAMAMLTEAGGAVAIARSVSDPGARIGALVHCARALAAHDRAEANRLAEEARALVRALPRPLWYAEAVAHVCHALKHHQATQAVELAESAVALARQVSPKRARDSLHGGLAVLLAELGQGPRALAVASEASVAARARTLYRVGLAAPDLKTRAAARTALEACIPQLRKGEQSSIEKETLPLTLPASDPFWSAPPESLGWRRILRAPTLSDAVREQAGAGNFDTALRLARELNSPETRAATLSQASIRASSRNDLEGARRLADEAQAASNQIRGCRCAVALLQTAKAFAACGDPKAAKEAVRASESVPRGHLAEGALLPALAQVQVLIDDQQAGRTADGVAAAESPKALSPEAKDLVGRALRHREWSACLREIAIEAPDAVARLGDLSLAYAQGH